MSANLRVVVLGEYPFPGELGSEDMHKPHKPRKISRLMCGLIAVITGSEVWALDCEDIAAIDREERAGGAFLMWTGCFPLNAQAIADRWSELPEIAQIVFSASYAVPGQQFPDLGPGSRADELTDGEPSLLKTWAISSFTAGVVHTEFWYDKIADYYGWDWGSPKKSDGKRDDSFLAQDKTHRGLQALIEGSPVFENFFAVFISDFNFSETFPFFVSIEELEGIIATADMPRSRWLSQRIAHQSMFASSEPIFLSPDAETRSDFPPQDSSQAGLVYAFDTADIPIQGDVDTLAIADRSAESGYLMGIAFSSAMLMDGRLQERTYGFDLIEDAAAYGSPLALWLKALWYGQRGPEGDVYAAEQAYIELSQRGLSVANQSLYFLALNRGDYLSAAKWALKNSMEGLLDYEDAGYVALAKVLPMLGWPRSKQTAFLDDLYEHCLAEVVNITMKDAVASAHEACQGFGGSSEKNDLLAILEIDETELEASLERAFLAIPDPSLSLNPGKYLAVMISNSEYDAWDDLKSPLNDVRLIGSVLAEKYGFEVRFVSNETRRNILGSVYEAAKELTFNDHLLVYYAGHGVVDEVTDNAYWIPSQATRDFRPDWISGDELLDALKTVPARHILLVADSCYSGKLLRSGLPVEENPNQQAIERLFSKRARVALTSGGNEPVVDSSGGGKNSIFALALSDALITAESALPVSSIYKQIFSRVTSELSQTPQYDGIRELGHDGGDFVFIPTGTE